jgi:hypothetical protein
MLRLTAIEESNNMHENTNSGGLRGLLLLNIALLAVLAAVTFGPTAGAQQGTRGRGEYTMVTGGAMGTDAGVIYIADVNNQELIAMVYNTNSKVLDGVGYRNLAADASNVRPSRPSN